MTTPKEQRHPYHVRTFELAGLGEHVGQYVDPKRVTLDDYLKQECEDGYDLHSMDTFGSEGKMVRVVTRSMVNPDYDPNRELTVQAVGYLR